MAFWGTYNLIALRGADGLTEGALFICLTTDEPLDAAIAMVFSI